MRCTIFSSRWVSGSSRLMAMPPVFFFLKLMLGGLRFRRMPTYGAGQQVRSKQQRHRQVCGCVGGWGGRAGGHSKATSGTASRQYGALKCEDTFSTSRPGTRQYQLQCTPPHTHSPTPTRV